MFFSYIPQNLLGNHSKHPFTARVHASSFTWYFQLLSSHPLVSVSASISDSLRWWNFLAVSVQILRSLRGRRNSFLPLACPSCGSSWFTQAGSWHQHWAQCWGLWCEEDNCTLHPGFWAAASTRVSGGEGGIAIAEINREKNTCQQKKVFCLT